MTNINSLVHLMLESSEEDNPTHQPLASKAFNFLNKHKGKIAIGLGAIALSNRKHIKHAAMNHGLLKKPIGLKIKDALRTGVKTMVKHPKLTAGLAAGAAVTGADLLLKNSHSKVTVLDEPPANNSKVSTSIYDVPNIHKSRTLTKSTTYKPSPIKSITHTAASNNSSSPEQSITDQFRQVHKRSQSQLRDGISNVFKENPWV